MELGNGGSASLCPPSASTSGARSIRREGKPPCTIAAAALKEIAENALIPAMRPVNSIRSVAGKADEAAADRGDKGSKEAMKTIAVWWLKHLIFFTPDITLDRVPRKPESRLGA